MPQTEQRIQITDLQPGNVHAVTHIGKRKNNEDYARACSVPDKGTVLIIADGMGGGPGGELASKAAAETVLSAFHRSPGETNIRRLADAILQANSRVRSLARKTGQEGMGTTLTAAVVDPKGAMTVGHAGDSRLYLLRDKRLVRLTIDHIVPEFLYQNNRLEEHEIEHHPFANVLHNTVDGNDSFNPDYQLLSLRRGDRLLLCTDGVHRNVRHRVLERVLAQAKSARKAAKQIIQLTKARPGRTNNGDNATALVYFHRPEPRLLPFALEGMHRSLGGSPQNPIKPGSSTKR